MSFSRRPRFVQAEPLGVPAWDSLRLVPPASCLRVLQQARDALVSDSARDGIEWFRAMSDAQQISRYV